MVEEQVSDKEFRVWACRCPELRQYPVYEADLASYKRGRRRT